MKDAEGLILKEISGERCKSDFGSGTAGFEEAEGGEQGQPEVVLALVGEVAFFGEAAESGDGIAAVEDFALLGRGGRRKDQVAFLDDHQEQQAIDQSQQGFVVVISGELSGGELLAERFVGGVIEESVAEAEDGMFDGGGESFADAGSGIEGILVVAFDQAFGGGVAGAGQSGSVQDAVEDGEVGEETVGEDAFKVEFDEALFDESGGIAEESEVRPLVTSP